MAGFFDRLKEGLARTREVMTEQFNVIFDRGPDLDTRFWEDLEETLILADFGGPATIEIVSQLEDTARRLALPDATAVLERLAESIAAQFCETDNDLLETTPVCLLFVGINGSGKTTTVGKLAKAGVDSGRRVLLGSADTFRAAAIEQLDIWAERAGVEVVKRQRGADPASVSYEVIEKAEACGADLVLIDTAGRLHTSDDLMRELIKVVNVTRKRAGEWQKTKAVDTVYTDIEALPVKTVLVIDATTGQNGLAQAREFNKALDLDGVIITKLDGTAKGGITVAISHELGLPVLRVGIGEKIDDLKPFDALDFARAMVGLDY
ncbi:MAG: signal recognition particle-docking protein FtsY [Coriobacteriales bacterium]|jgi:fused signal recognition particle receptor|nr:signal recognition particle-docking protein FtsY [Coriobacteriales bacterium]